MKRYSLIINAECATVYNKKGKKVWQGFPDDGFCFVPHKMDITGTSHDVWNHLSQWQYIPVDEDYGETGIYG